MSSVSLTTSNILLIVLASTILVTTAQLLYNYFNRPYNYFNRPNNEDAACRECGCHLGYHPYTGCCHYRGENFHHKGNLNDTTHL